jgi:uncharacterized membrane protein YecN with MAPEG domain
MAAPTKGGSMDTALTCTALLGLLVFGLGLWVSVMRGRVNRVIGHDLGPAEPLHKAVRAHGNAAEYAPMMAILMLAVGFRGPSGWMEWTFWAATVSRYMHAYGMIAGGPLDRPNPFRFVGALGTYVTGIALVIAAFVA